jgi:hypothetical protein
MTTSISFESNASSRYKTVGRNIAKTRINELMDSLEDGTHAVRFVNQTRTKRFTNNFIMDLSNVCSIYGMRPKINNAAVQPYITINLGPDLNKARAFALSIKGLMLSGHIRP